MRTITSNAQTLLSQNMGTEVMVIVEIEWVSGGSVFYSDQAVSDCQAKVISLGGFDTSMILEGSGDSQELSVVLDDTDGTIRNIYDSNDIHKRPAKVYLLHKGLSLQDKILVFKGELVTPIQWSETTRSVSFNVLSKLNAAQVGFSMEEGNFPNIPDEALGKAWPLVFGQVCHLPAVKVRAPRRGYLLQGEGIHDFTLEPRICQAMKIQCPAASTGDKVVPIQGPDNIYTSKTVQTIGPDPECVNRRFGEICKLQDLYEQQMAHEHTSLEIYNGVSFPQDTDLTIFISNAIFKGVFSGNTFTIANREHPEYATFNHQACREVPEAHWGVKLGVPQFGSDLNYASSAGGYDRYNDDDSLIKENRPWKLSGGSTENNAYYEPNQTTDEAFASCDAALVPTPGLVGGPPDSWAYYDEMEASDFFWVPAGSEVFIEAEAELMYIASLLPGTVDSVSAYRVAPNGFKYLTEVPADYYTVYETDYGGYQVVEIGLNKALSLYNDQWEDQLYVSFTSSVGGNPCDIIEWLLNKYTDMTADTTTFAQVKSALTNYPKNFYLTTRPDVHALIQDIAYQSRCSVYVRNDVIYIKYLSVEPTPERTLSESDILSGSFVEFLSETEDVYTTHNIDWRKAGAVVRSDQELDHKLVLKYNVAKYGTVEKAWDYYTDNIYELVLKTSTFWLIRKSNSWKKARFQLPIKHMDLDVGDCITLDIEQFSAPVKAVIEQMRFNPDDHTIDVECWTPVRSGETEAFYWAWPAHQSQVMRWPLPGETSGELGYNFEVTPPTGHILLGGQHRDDQLVITTGDLHPSDLDDLLPTVRCETSDYLNFDEEPPEITAKEIAQSTARAQMTNQMAAAPGANVEESDPNGSCGVGTGIGCEYEFDVTWHMSLTQGHARYTVGHDCGGPCQCGYGCPSCTGPFFSSCFIFMSWDGALQGRLKYLSQMKSISDTWECMERAVTMVSPIRCTSTTDISGRPCMGCGGGGSGEGSDSDTVAPGFTPADVEAAQLDETEGPYLKSGEIPEGLVWDETIPGWVNIEE